MSVVARVLLVDEHVGESLGHASDHPALSSVSAGGWVATQARCAATRGAPPAAVAALPQRRIGLRDPEHLPAGIQSGDRDVVTAAGFPLLASQPQSDVPVGDLSAQAQLGAVLTVSQAARHCQRAVIVMPGAAVRLDLGDERGVTVAHEDAVRLLVDNTPGQGHFDAIRTRRWIYAEYRNGDRELYDLVNDPYELQSKHADPRHAAIRKALDGDLVAEHAAFVGEREPVRA